MKDNSNPSITPGQPMQVDYNALKTELEGFKKDVVKKYPFTLALLVLPSQAFHLIEEDELLPKEAVANKPIHVVSIIPEDQFKNAVKIKAELVNFAKKTKHNLWIHVKTPVDLWNYGLDSKYDLMDAVAQGFPLYDKAFLGALRVASIHKTLVLRKFDKYVASYVIAGSLVRGTASKDSDVDVFVVIDDTDVKRMSRVELLERLRGMIHQYIQEASGLAGVKNILNVQVYLLTDFWQSVKDAHPVMFTFIRDGIPLYDRGTFIPWKLLLKMGKIKPSSEAIDLYMKQGDQTEDFVKRRLLDAMVDIYYGIVTPTQALMMLAGEAPPVPKVIAEEAKKLFVDKEKLLKLNDIKTLEKAVNLFKQYEYGKLKEYSGTNIDLFLKECKEYNVKLKALRSQLEKRVQQKTADELYDQVFQLLKTFFGNKSQSQLVSEFDKQMVKKGKVAPRSLGLLKNMLDAKNKIASGKLNNQQVDSVKRDALEFIDSLVEYGQRADLIKTKKAGMQISYQGRKAELIILGGHLFIVEGKDIKKIHAGKLVPGSKEELDKAIIEHSGKLAVKISGSAFIELEKALGNFELEM